MLDCIIDAGRSLSTAELMLQTGLQRSTLNRILSQLEAAGYLQREPMKRSFLPGPRSRKLAFQVISREDFGGARHATLQALSEKIGETCNCTMLDGNHTIYFDRVETNWPYRILLPVGSHLPLHCTASGKLFLALMPARQRRRLITAAPLKRYTDSTITNVKQLGYALKKIKSDGYGVDNEEFMDGMVALSVPIFNAAHEVCFAVAVHAPSTRKSLDDLKVYLPALREAAIAINNAHELI